MVAVLIRMRNGILPLSRTVSDAFAAAVLGSNEPVVWADFWLNGEVIREGLGPVAGSVEYDSTRDVEAHLSLTVEDTESEGSRLSETIHAIGMKCNVRAGFNLAGTVETVSYGWFDVSEVSAVDSWEWYDWATGATKTGSVVTVEGHDYVSVLAASDFLSPQQPAASADAWATIQDLAQTAGVSVLDPGYSAKIIPTNLVFEWGRLDAIWEIAKLWDARPVMTDAGQLTLATDSSGDTIEDFGVRVNMAAWVSESSSQNLRNGVTFLGKSPEGLQLVGTATEDTGPARWGGPLGFRPLRAASDLMSTQEMVDAAAVTRLQTEISDRAVTQTVDALWNPAVEVRDRLTLKLPDRDEPDVQVLGTVLPLTGGAMQVTLRLPVKL